MPSETYIKSLDIDIETWKQEVKTFAEQTQLALNSLGDFLMTGGNETETEELEPNQCEEPAGVAIDPCDMPRNQNRGSAGPVEGPTGPENLRKKQLAKKQPTEGSKRGKTESRNGTKVLRFPKQQRVVRNRLPECAQCGSQAKHHAFAIQRPRDSRCLSRTQ